jgi:hypothetical protein
LSRTIAVSAVIARDRKASYFAMKVYDSLRLAIRHPERAQIFCR